MMCGCMFYLIIQSHPIQFITFNYISYKQFTIISFILIFPYITYISYITNCPVLIINHMTYLMIKQSKYKRNKNASHYRIKPTTNL